MELNDYNLKAINDTYKNAHIALQSISDLIPTIKSEELKKELQEYVKKNTAPYKYPRIVEFVDELPKTVSGKIMRGKIRKQDNDQ